jgi:hypothetical protein
MGTMPGIVSRPQPASLQPAERLLDPIREAGFTALGAEVDANDHLHETNGSVRRADQTVRRIMLPLPSTRGPIAYPFGVMVEDDVWIGANNYYTMQRRVDEGRRWDPKGEILPPFLRNDELGSGGVCRVYPGTEGYALKFAWSTYAAETLLIGHAILHAFGVAHLEIRTDEVALNVARTQSIVAQRLLPPGSIQLREITRQHDELNSSARAAVENALGWYASIELQELHAQIKEIHDDRLLCNEAILRGHCYLDMMQSRWDLQHYFIIDAFKSGTWNKNVFYNENPEYGWFLLDW